MASVDVSRIGSNIGALNSLSALTTINNQLAVHQTRLATGKQINSAADDPAGLTIATKLNARSEGLKVALGNIGDAKNLLSVAESGLTRISDILVQMRNKAEQGASDTMGTEERSAIKTQMEALVAQIDDQVNQTTWNGKKLLDGLTSGFGGTLTFQTGPDSSDTTVLSGLKDLTSTEDLGLATSGAAGVAGTTWNSASVSGGTADNAALNGQTKLATGEYTLRFTFGAADGAGASSVQMFDANGNQLMIDQDGDTAGASGAASSMTFTNAAGADSTLDFGNGLQVTVKQNQGTGATAEQVVHYQAGATGLGLDETQGASFRTFMGKVGTALSTVSGELTKIGSLSSRLTFKEDQITAAQINTEAAYNRIMNANMAEEQVNASKLQILQQTSTAMLAQANAAPQFLLSLFR
jgi:flagellin